MMAVQFSHLKHVTLLGHQTLLQLVDQALVDDAVFELIVTDSLDQTLARLDSPQSASARSQEQRRVAHERGIDYLIEASVTPIRRQWHIAYNIVCTKTGRTVHARSFYEVDNRPNIVAREITKHTMRAMWKVLNKEKQG
jgi:hypothetical protein